MIAAAVTTPLILPCAAAAPGPVELRLEMYGFAGLHVVTVRESFSQSATRYGITMSVESRGVADLFTQVNSRSEVAGRIVDGRLVPQRLVRDTERNGRWRRTIATYGAAGAIAATSTPALQGPRAPVTKAQMRGTVDELTAYLIQEEQLARTGSCAITVPVFDGIRRYDMVFTDAGSETLAPSGDSRFAGPTHVCEINRRKISGFPANGGTAEGVDHGRIWFAHLLPGVTMTPVKMKLDTELGHITGYLAALRGLGVNLALAD